MFGILTILYSAFHISHSLTDKLMALAKENIDSNENLRLLRKIVPSCLPKDYLNTDHQFLIEFAFSKSNVDHIDLL